MGNAEYMGALFAGEAQMTFDTEGATAFKTEHEAAIKAKEAEADALTGKDNKKARQEKSKEAAAMKLDKKYIDACKVCKGLEPPGGCFMTKVEAKPAAAAAAPESTEVDATKEDE